MSDDLVQRLRGVYTVPVNDGAGTLLGSDTYTRTFAMPPICAEAADEIERLRAEVAGLRDRHGSDSAELRRLCEARDEARRNATELREDLREARAERDALRERIEKAVVLAMPEPAAHSSMHRHGHDAQLILTQKWATSHGLAGKRVALVVV